ncbi:MAG: N-acetylmuramoyl-L-alanine amidase, partial [Acidobacteriota bacterium]|nr:N-acetylmuramoyl-L-alanine amidase [Acidobacteriota bacterium]
LYSRALDRERVIRKDAPRPTLQQLRGLVDTYAAIARRFPGSAYSDNALWQGGNLALLAYERFGQPADRRNAERLLLQLKRSHPSSSLVARVDEVLGRVRRVEPARASGDGVTGAPVSGPTRPSVGLKPLPRLQTRGSWPVAITPQGVSASAEGAAAVAAVATTVGPTAADEEHSLSSGAGVAAAGATIRGITRTAIDGGMRVIIELDGESSYRSEQLERPRRVFFDLKDTRAVATLQDATLKFGDELVREVRLGRHPRNTTRIVFDMHGADSYSVFTLYNPFRMVIDFKAGAAAPTAAAARIIERHKSAAGIAGLPTVPIVSTLPPPTLSAPAMARTGREPVEPGAWPLPSRPVTSATPIPPAGPAANADGKFSIARQLGLGVSRIVIDAGHGGHDPGAQSTGISESEVTLDLALRLSRLLEKQPGMEVVLTRETDVFVPLEERTAIANRQGADLFLSIHANASRNSSARGVETYFLNFASTPEASAVAARENSASARAMHQLPDIVRAIALNNKIDESRDFADMVQRSMVRRLAARNKQVRDLGVKQAPFVVLIGAAMPSVLAEVSFVTNRQEGQLLKTGAYRQQIAEALFDAVVRYQQSLKKWKTGAVGVGAR